MKNRTLKIGDWVKIKKEFQDRGWFFEFPVQLIKYISEYDDYIVKCGVDVKQIAHEYLEYYDMRLEKLKRILED